MKVLDFIHEIKVGNNKYLYDSRNFSIWQLSDRDMIIYEEFIDDKNGDFINILMDNQIIDTVDNKVIDTENDKNLSFLSKARMKKIIINYARIKLTTYCNFECKYCFVNKNKMKMSMINLKKLLDVLILMNKNSILSIQYFGGEPLLEMKLIKYAHEYLEKAYLLNKIKGFKEEIVTNGFLLSDEVIEYLKEAKINVTISIDGIREINDIKRINSFGEGTFDIVKERILRYKEITGIASILITLQEHNMKNFKYNTIKLIKDLGVTDIGINMPQPCCRGWQVSGKNMFEAIVGIYDFCYSNNIRFVHGGNNIPYALKSRKINYGSCSNYLLEEKSCLVGVSIDPDLSISTCIVDKSKKNKYNLNLLQDIQLDKIKDWFLENNYKDKCYSCIAYGICTGMCNMEKEYVFDNIDRCYFYKNMVEWYIKKFIEKEI